MRPIPSMIAALLVLGSASALAQNQAPRQPPASKPVDDSASYGPVLNPQTPPATTAQPTTSSTQAIGEARPQAQEERAGQPPASKPADADPSARPAPQSTQPQQGATGDERRQPQKRPPQVNRRSVEQRIESTPRIAAPQPKPSVQVESGVAPAPAGPQSTQVVGCVGSACTGANGATYNIPAGGGPGVSSSGRPCTSNGTTIQCL